MSIRRGSSLKAFTLIELSIVILVLSLLTAAGMRYFNSTNDANMLALTNSNLDMVEMAMMNYRNEYGRLPCPALLTSAENTAAFGVEVGTAGNGNCTGANHLNSTADPKASDANYDSATLNEVAEGAIPTKTLKLADKYAYDAWGSKIYYAIDIRYTAKLGFTTYGPTSKVGAVVVLKTSADTLANALSGTIINGISYNAIYALISAGKNTQGGFVRTLNSTSARASAGSTNTDELQNCHCNTGGGFTTYDRYYVQKPKTIDSASYTDNFDDIVRFKTRANMLNTTELQ